MLRIQNISKTYKTGDLVQTALDGVSLDLRDNEFVAILGPSGSGKTTLLNIIGGLDRYDSGDLIIDGISTKKYKDRDWDSYRNHTIGFVFQSYNLIGHQTILSNVELALTISGVSRKERTRRAAEALEKVGLGDQLHKKPNQLSGGQMQRVAIARALVNDPDILLADEPTGALDTLTSVQVMELLKEVAKDRLVVMVTHNPELAESYANRIVNLRDGRIIGDSNPYVPDEKSLAAPEHKNMGKASMSLGMSLALSFSNLRTKLTRTLLTAFAGSIGIIGIALILSLSTGVDSYITDIQKDTMTSYPITISAQAIDLSSLLEMGQQNAVEKDDHEKDGVFANTLGVEMASGFRNSITENNLTAFKQYLENPDSPVQEYIGENGVVYGYNVNFDVFGFDPDGVLIDTTSVTIDRNTKPGSTSSMSQSMTGSFSSMMGGSFHANFSEMLPDQKTGLVSNAVKDKYDLLAGKWPEDYRETVLIVDINNEIIVNQLYQLGFLPSSEYTAMMNDLKEGKEVTIEAHKWSFEEAMDRSYYLLPSAFQYVKNEDGTFRSISRDKEALKENLDKAIELKIVGVVRSTDTNGMSLLTGPIGYTKTLTDKVIAMTEESEVVKAQRANAEVNVLNGLTFAPADDATKAEDAKMYLQALNTSEKASLYTMMVKTMYADKPEMLEMILSQGEAVLAAGLDQALTSGMLTEEILVGIYDSYISTGSYEENMTAFGVVSKDAPSSINIYCDTFENKDMISGCIEDYNKSASEEDKITYTDYVGLLMSSVTTIIDVISIVLIAFVAVSLVVSSIMIGIITYISVLERTKEIGILRAVGASKRNISQVFNAETFIIGLTAGLMGIGISELILIPGNAIIHKLADSDTVNAFIRPEHAVILVLLSVILTLIGGLIPSKKAANRDPVAALRSE